ncbi:MAG TPA: ketoacyl-ACP synthase III, partial [Saprospiraceae bacterium]|nr:ketoacyl-ACP synthase III [Saprospiraceae bacterium]
MRNAIIIGSGSYAPEQIVPNSFFNSILGTDVDSWLREVVQISERRWCQDEESVADLIEKACQAAMDDAGITAG